jgi:hypothetical protein
LCHGLVRACACVRAACVLVLLASQKILGTGPTRHGDDLFLPVPRMKNRVKVNETQASLSKKLDWCRTEIRQTLGIEEPIIG